MVYLLTRSTRPLPPTLFPYTTLFRSSPVRARPHLYKLMTVIKGVVPIGINADELRAVCDRLFDLRPQVNEAVRSKRDRKSTRLNSSHRTISYAVFCLKKKNNKAVGRH